MTMATSIVVIKDGIIKQVGSPKEIYDKPDNVFVGGFIGSPAMNFLTGTLKDDYFHIGDYKIKIPAGKIKPVQPYNNKNVILGIRPEDIHDEPVFLNTAE